MPEAAFVHRSARVKAATPHGLTSRESRHLALFEGDVRGAEDRAITYTVLTRLSRYQNWSVLTVVSAYPELQVYGSTWPDFVEV
jgi:hypothetical protein